MKIGLLFSLAMEDLTITPVPLFYHDYAQSPTDMSEDVPEEHNTGCQTELTMEDILDKADLPDVHMERDASGEPDVVEWITQSDERVNFYTGIRSNRLLNGKTLKGKGMYISAVIFCWRPPPPHPSGRSSFFFNPREWEKAVTAQFLPAY